MRRFIPWSLLVALALVLLACARPEPQPVPFVLPPTATAQVGQTEPLPQPSVTLTATALASDTEPLPEADARPTVASSLQVVQRPDSPIVGGLQPPDAVAWYALSSPDPLAYLLGSSLHRSLLDPQTGALWLAERWAVRGNLATFTLPADAVWSDGSPLRAADVVDLLLQAGEAGDLYGLESARATDARTVEVELASPICPTLTRVATWPMVDVQEWPPARTSSLATVDEAGATEWSIEPSRFRYRRFPDELALREAWETGEVNSIVGASRLTMGPLPGEQQAAEQPGPLLATLLFRMDDPLAGDITVREALTLATNRAALFEAAYGFTPGDLLTALLPPGHWAAPNGSLPGDADEAARLLDSAEWRDRDGDGVRENALGQPLRVTLSLPLSQDVRWERLAVVLAEQWAAVGVALVPTYLEAYPLQERLHDGRWQVALVAYHTAADPDQLAMWSAPAPDDLVGNDLNVTGYRNSSVTALLTEAAEVPGCDPSERAALYEQAWAQLLEDRPLWPLFALPLDEVHRPSVGWPMGEGGQ